MAIAANGGEGTTFVLGGARSGKSRYAEAVVTGAPKPWVYVATAEARDDEMAQRIAEHKARRGTEWRTIEAPLELPQAIKTVEADATVLVDCLTLWLSNVMHGDVDIDLATRELESTIVHRKGSTVLVSNEVGLGLVPETALGRAFRDAQGRLNQRIASIAGRVVFMVAGQPLVVKGSS